MSEEVSYNDLSSYSEHLQNDLQNIEQRRFVANCGELLKKDMEINVEQRSSSGMADTYFQTWVKYDEANDVETDIYLPLYVLSRQYAISEIAERVHAVMKNRPITQGGLSTFQRVWHFILDGGYWTPERIAEFEQLVYSQGQYDLVKKPFIVPKSPDSEERWKANEPE